MRLRLVGKTGSPGVTAGWRGRMLREPWNRRLGGRSSECRIVCRSRGSFHVTGMSTSLLGITNRRGQGGRTKDPRIARVVCSSEESCALRLSTRACQLNFLSKLPVLLHFLRLPPLNIPCSSLALPFLPLLLPSAPLFLHSRPLKGKTASLSFFLQELRFLRLALFHTDDITKRDLVFLIVFGEAYTTSRCRTDWGVGWYRDLLHMCAGRFVRG